jgi:hypothetical protein
MPHPIRGPRAAWRTRSIDRGRYGRQRGRDGRHAAIPHDIGFTCPLQLLGCRPRSTRLAAHTVAVVIQTVFIRPNHLDGPRIRRSIAASACAVDIAGEGHARVVRRVAPRGLGLRWRRWCGCWGRWWRCRRRGRRRRRGCCRCRWCRGGGCCGRFSRRRSLGGRRPIDSGGAIRSGFVAVVIRGTPGDRRGRQQHDDGSDDPGIPGCRLVPRWLRRRLTSELRPPRLWWRWIIAVGGRWVLVTHFFPSLIGGQPA